MPPDTLRNVMIDLGPGAFFLLTIWMQTLQGQPTSEKELIRVTEMSKYKVGQALLKLENRGYSTQAGEQWIIGDDIRQLSFFNHKLEPVFDLSPIERGPLSPIPETDETKKSDEAEQPDPSSSVPDDEKNFFRPNPEKVIFRTESLKQLSESVVNQDNNLTTDSLDSPKLAEKIFSASEQLFGEKITARKEFYNQGRMLLAWTAQIYATRDQLKTRKHQNPRPARVVYRNLADGKQPEIGYLQAPLDFLPTWFVEEIGLGDHLERCPACQLGAHDCQCIPCPECGELTGIEDHDLCICERCPECNSPLWQCGDCRNMAKATERCETRWNGGTSMSPAQAWQAALGQMQMEMPKAAFDTWVRDAALIDAIPDQRVLIVGVQNGYARDWLESRLTSSLTRLLTGIMNQSIEVQFVST